MCIYLSELPVESKSSAERLGIDLPVLGAAV